MDYLLPCTNSFCAPRSNITRKITHKLSKFYQSWFRKPMASAKTKSSLGRLSIIIWQSFSLIIKRTLQHNYCSESRSSFLPLHLIYKATIRNSVLYRDAKRTSYFLALWVQNPGKGAWTHMTQSRLVSTPTPTNSIIARLKFALTSIISCFWIH
jgi:hypothetical protein